MCEDESPSIMIFSYPPEYANGQNQLLYFCTSLSIYTTFTTGTGSLPFLCCNTTTFVNNLMVYETFFVVFILPVENIKSTCTVICIEARFYMYDRELLF